MRRCILPPVPGPKIRGVDFQCLKVILCLHLIKMCKNVKMNSPPIYSFQSTEGINSLIINQNFPLMVAWKDQEEYLIVTESDSGLQPDPSNPPKRTKSLIFSAAFCLDTEIQCKESTQKDGKTDETDNLVKSNKVLSEEHVFNKLPIQLTTEKPECASMNFVNTEPTDLTLSNPENYLKPFINNGYVDIRTHAESIKEMDGEEEAEYSRGKVVNGDGALDLVKMVSPPNSPGFMDVQRPEEDISEDYSRVKDVSNDNMVFLQKHCVSVNSSCKEKGNHYTDCAIQKTRDPHVNGPIKVGICTKSTGGGYVDTVPELLLM